MVLTIRYGKKGSVIRLIYPQWQGGNIAKWISEIKNPALALWTKDEELKIWRTYTYDDYKNRMA